MHNLDPSLKWQTLDLKSCTICGSINFRLHYSGSKLNIPMSYSQCDDCSAIFQNPLPTRESLASIFNDMNLFGGLQDSNFDEGIAYYNYSSYEKALSRNASPMLKKLSSFMPPPAKLLEIGSATGWFLNSARNFGYHVQGLDISATLAMEVEKRYGIHVVINAIENSNLPDQFFDIICCFAGIECWQDLHKGFSNVFRMLRKNGLFFFNYVDCQAIIARVIGKKYSQYNPCINHLFTRRTMHHLLMRHGFKILNEGMSMTHFALGPFFQYFQLESLFRLSRFFKLDNLVFLVPNIRTRTIIATRS